MVITIKNNKTYETKKIHEEDFVNYASKGWVKSEESFYEDSEDQPEKSYKRGRKRKED